MCQSEEQIIPESVRTDSTISSLDSASSDDWDPSPHSKRIPSTSSAVSVTRHVLYGALGGAVTAAGIAVFSLWLPFFLAPEAASKTYDWAFYTYDAKISHFDNTVWTYGTDYALAVITGSLAISILGYSTKNNQSLSLRSSALLLSYCASVTAGGLSHHFYLDLETRNSASFRFLWTICVGTVTLASIPMGLAGSKVLHQFQTQHPTACHPLLKQVPVLSDVFWWVFGLAVTAVCVWGGLSFQRPACDIFIAGITQTPSSFYIMIFYALVDHPKVQKWVRMVGFVGFISNAPLLPMYPLLCQYTDWSLGSINTLLHCWLCVSWCMQGVSLRHMVWALQQDDVDTKLQKSS
jgi:hypothetical protein